MQNIKHVKEIVQIPVDPKFRPSLEMEEGEAKASTSAKRDQEKTMKHVKGKVHVLVAFAPQISIKESQNGSST